MTLGDWELSRLTASDIPCRGYWSPPLAVSDLLLLTRRGETWMSLMPVQVEGLRLAADCARGKVVLFGLGLGWLAATCALRAEVDQVTVVELDRELIGLHRALGLFEHLPGGVGAKVRIVEGDALDWRPDGSVDLLQADIWQSLVGDDRLAQVARMQANVAASAIHFWGQELEIARHALAAGRRLDDAGIAATVAALGLPLAGTDRPDYAAKLRAAAANWMNGHWLSGTPLPVDLQPCQARDSAMICDVNPLDIGEPSNETGATARRIGRVDV